MSVEADILGALMSRVNSLGLGVPVAWPGVNFDPPADGKYIAATFIPNGAGRVAISTGTAHRHIGMLQLSVFWPRGAGQVAPLEKASEIVDGFTTDLKLTAGSNTVRITKKPDLAGPLTEPHATHVPVTVSWETFA